MEIQIAATLVDTLRYRLYAQATMPTDGAVRVDVVPVVGGRAEARMPRAARSGDGVHEAPATLIAPAQLKPSELSAAVRALRERTWREVQSQIEHFCRTTGRDWQLRKLHYGELMPQLSLREDETAVTTRLTLVADVELGARAPVLH